MIIVEKIFIESLNRNVVIRTMLPKKYDKTKKYDILYMFDGQNIFYDELATYKMGWKVDELVTAENGFRELIIVGIDYKRGNQGLNRVMEYSPYMPNSYTQKHFEKRFKLPKEFDYIPQGDIFSHEFINTIIPFVESKYKVEENRYICGSSMGGYISLYIILKYSKLFKKAYCLSNAFWHSFEELKDFIDEIDVTSKIEIYMDCGDKESTTSKDHANKYIQVNREIYSILKHKKNIGNINYLEIEGGKHNEIYWNKRLNSVFNDLRV